MTEKNNSQNDKSVEFLCRTCFGRLLLHFILFIRIPKLAGFFLRSPLSHFMIGNFIRKNKVDMKEFEGQKFLSFNDFFTRRKQISFDSEKNHLISPCDSFLSVVKITENAVFSVKGFDYSLRDFFEPRENCTLRRFFWNKGTNPAEMPSESYINSLSEKFRNGECLIFRLCTTDYHRYCYIDSGIKSENHFIEGSLYSVQPAACEKFRVYTKNRRSWTIMECENFGTVAQIEVGAFSVGGIKNHKSKGRFNKGEEKGYFDLYGSTIVLLFEPQKISLIPEIQEQTKNGAECKVRAGQWIGVGL